jgi:DNA helicase HerA-like ATPase
MTNDEEFESSEYPVLDIDPWDEDDLLRQRRREFPTRFETVVDTVDGPRVTSLDLRDLTDEELEKLVPINKYAYLELVHRQISNLE